MQGPSGRRRQVQSVEAEREWPSAAIDGSGVFGKITSYAHPEHREQPVCRSLRTERRPAYVRGNHGQALRSRRVPLVSVVRIPHQRANRAGRDRSDNRASRAHLELRPGSVAPVRTSRRGLHSDRSPSREKQPVRWFGGIVARREFWIVLVSFHLVHHLTHPAACAWASRIGPGGGQSQP